LVKHRVAKLTNKRFKPIPWYGGKYELAQKLIPFIPKHHSYIEVFAGGAGVFWAKDRSDMEVLNDLDSGLVNFYRVIRDPVKFKQFRFLVELRPYSRAEYDHCKTTWRDCHDDADRAARWFVVARQSFNAVFGGGWKRDTKRSRRGMCADVSSYLSVVERLPEIHERMMGVQVENRDFRKVLNEYDAPDAFFYLDPPYIRGTRRAPNVYQHEMTDEDHEDMVELLLGLKGKAILSGYAHPIYGPLECAGWKRVDYQVNCRTAVKSISESGVDKETAKKKMARTETVWLTV
jgi:DNA adenine methylase